MRRLVLLAALITASCFNPQPEPPGVTNTGGASDHGPGRGGGGVNLSGPGTTQPAAGEGGFSGSSGYLGMDGGHTFDASGDAGNGGPDAGTAGDAGPKDGGAPADDGGGALDAAEAG